MDRHSWFQFAVISVMFLAFAAIFTIYIPKAISGDNKHRNEIVRVYKQGKAVFCISENMDKAYRVSKSGRWKIYKNTLFAKKIGRDDYIAVPTENCSKVFPAN